MHATQSTALKFSMGAKVRSGAPGGTRTPDLLVRSQTLYPTELRAHSNALNVQQFTVNSSMISTRRQSSPHWFDFVCERRTFSVITEIECSGKTTTKSDPVLIIPTCVEIALGVAKLFAAPIERPLIVSITALEASPTPPTCTVVRNDFCGFVLTAFMKRFWPSLLRLTTTSK